MQRLRGRIYLEDGAIQPWEVNEDGRFVMQDDEQCWHLLLKDNEEHIIGCARYLVHPNTAPFQSLKLSQSPIATHREWAEKIRLAVLADLKQAREYGLSYVEISGWALSEEWRGTRAALDIVTGSYALAALWGGCLASCTATVRHGATSVLRRIGGASFEVSGEALPPYEDPRYGCTMELLRFDYRSPAPKFIPLIDELKIKLANTPLIKRPIIAAHPFAASKDSNRNAMRRPREVVYKDMY
jgi:hypothetical protein